MVDLDALTAAVEAGDRATAVSLTQAAIDAGTAPDEVLEAMTRAMTEVGRRFACNEGVYVPEMLISARAMKEASALLEPLLAASGITPQYTAVVGTVQGDLHDIGKNLVGMMLKGANFEVIDLGTNVAPARFAEAAREHKADMVGISALLTTTMVGMKECHRGHPRGRAEHPHPRRRRSRDRRVRGRDRGRRVRQGRRHGGGGGTGAPRRGRLTCATATGWRWRSLARRPTAARCRSASRPSSPSGSGVTSGCAG